MDYLSSADLLPQLQSGFRQGHSTETAVMRVLSDILLAIDRGDIAALTLLDFSAAFDTVDHCKQLIAFATLLTGGFNRICQAVLSMSAAARYRVTDYSHLSPISSAVSRRGLC